MTRQLTLDSLKALVEYDPSTGVFTWRARQRMRAGKVAGGPAARGYRRIFVAGVSYLEHRLAWFYMTGRLPTNDIDHINGRRGDNRYANLREATRALNLENQRAARSDNTTGLLGVSVNHRGFSARIWVGGRCVHLGTFQTADLAHQAYLSAKRELHAGCTI